MILYSNGCPKCRILKAELDKLHMDYTVSDNFEGFEEKGLYCLPVLQINEKVMLLMGDAMRFIQRGELIGKEL